MFEPLSSFEDFEAFLAQFTNYERMRRVRYDKRRFGIGRMRALATELGDPHLAVPSVHIAGTKGKGSTTLMLEAILSAAGLSVGSYLSPHVEHLTERIRVGGEAVSAGALIQEINGMLEVLHRRREAGPEHFPSFFELMTALAMSCFRRRRVDWSIFEVGLGGRLDATNIILPRVCAITSIGLEHTEQLGSTLAEIAREKAGIVKAGVPVVVGPLPPEADATVRAVARRLGTRVFQVREGDAVAVPPARLRVRGSPATLPAGPVVGPALRTDLAIALALAREVLGERALTDDLVAAALARLHLPGRAELFSGDPPIVLDAAHTEDSARALRDTLEEMQIPRPRTLVFSIAAGKRLEPILDELTGVAEDWILTRADPIRSVPPARVREKAGKGDVIERPEEALEEALRRGRPVVATGSFYLLGRLRPSLRSRHLLRAR